MSDLPIAELVDAANEALQQFPGAVVHFKYTCVNCGERNVFEEPNTIYERGKCCKCGQEQEVQGGGFMLMTRMA